MTRFAQVASKEVTWLSYQAHEADRKRRFEIFNTERKVINNMKLNCCSWLDRNGPLIM
jgi:hypothetical protein